MTIPIITGSPGVYLTEVDASLQTKGVSTSVGAITGATRQGPLGPTLVTTGDEFTSQFGPSDTTWSFVHISALAFLSEANSLYMNRVVNTDAFYSRLAVENLTTSAAGTATNLFPALVGLNTDYSFGGKNVIHLNLSAPLTAGTSVSGVLSDGTNTITIPAVAYAISSNNTMGQIATAISTAINSFVVTFNSTLPAFPLTNGAAQTIAPIATNITTIRVETPGNTVYTATFTITGGSMFLTGSTVKLFDVFAQNPGDWANDIGILINKADIGVAQQLQLNFSAPLAATNSFTAQFAVNGNVVNVPSVAYAVSSPNTLAAIALGIKNALGGNSDAFVSGALSITIISPVDGPNTLVLNNATITGTAPPATSSATIVSGVSATDTFHVQVFSRRNTNVPLEDFRVSLFPQLNGFNNQLFIEDVINNSATKSNYIRVKVSTDDLPGKIIATSLPTTITWLGGGSDGSLPTNSQIINTLNTNFANLEAFKVNILINAGYTAIAIQQALVSLASTRKDCFAILDMPSNLQNTQDALTYRKTTLNIDSSYGAIYTPDLLILDTANDRNIYVPPSGYVGADYAKTDQDPKYGVWWAAAGTNRGKINNVLGLRPVNNGNGYAKGDRDILDADGINCIRNLRDGSGVAVWGVNTLQVKKSLLSYIPVRRLFIFTENSQLAALEQVDFDNITDQTYFLLKQQCDAFLQPIKDAGGITDFLNVVDKTNNKPFHKDAGQINITQYIVPVVPGKIIVLETVATPNSTAFNELITAGIG